MGLAKKCDRCGTFYEPYGKNLKELGGPSVNSIQAISRYSDGRICEHLKIFDLCPECLDSFLKWLKGGKQDGGDI